MVLVFLSLNAEGCTSAYSDCGNATRHAPRLLTRLSEPAQEMFRKPTGSSNSCSRVARFGMVDLSRGFSRGRVDEIAQRSAHHLARRRHHPGLAVHLLLPGSDAEPRDAQRPAASLR